MSDPVAPHTRFLAFSSSRSEVIACGDIGVSPPICEKLDRLESKLAGEGD